MKYTTESGLALDEFLFIASPQPAIISMNSEREQKMKTAINFMFIMIDCLFFLTIEIESSGSIFVDFLYDSEDVVLSQLVVQLPQDLLERVS